MLVKVFAGGNGRLGNNIGQLLHGLAFAVRSHADKVQLVASGGQLPQIFQFKTLGLAEETGVSGDFEGYPFRLASKGNPPRGSLLIDTDPHA